MIAYNTATPYFILGDRLEFFSNETAYGWMTIIYMYQAYHHLGNQLVNLRTAIDLWQKINGILLTQEEIEMVMIENSLTKE